MMQRDQLVLPFSEREYIDIRRAARILGLVPPTVVRLAENGFLQAIEYRPGKPRVRGGSGRRKIRYQSVVQFCDRLRKLYRIPDRRPPLSPHLRYCDRDLLPFPLDETINTETALDALGLRNCRKLPPLIEEGYFEAYRITPLSPWRIWAPSFSAYLSRIQEGPTCTDPYRVSFTECGL